jgi:DNA-binding MarR family transcriptional regulator
MTSLRPEDSLGFQVRPLSPRIRPGAQRHHGPRGISSGFWYFLRALWQEDGATQKRLSRLNNVSEPTTVAALNGMARAGLVVRQRNPDDARKQNIFLTARGRALEARLMPQAIAINAAASAGVSQRDLQICLKVLKQMSENLARQTAEAEGERVA